MVRKIEAYEANDGTVFRSKVEAETHDAERLLSGFMQEWLDKHGSYEESGGYSGASITNAMLDKKSGFDLYLKLHAVHGPKKN